MVSDEVSWLKSSGSGANFSRGFSQETNEKLPADFVDARGSTGGSAVAEEGLLDGMCSFFGVFFRVKDKQMEKSF